MLGSGVGSDLVVWRQIKCAATIAQKQTMAIERKRILPISSEETVLRGRGDQFNGEDERETGRFLTWVGVREGKRGTAVREGNASFHLRYAKFDCLPDIQLGTASELKNVQKDV